MYYCRRADSAAAAAAAAHRSRICFAYLVAHDEVEDSLEIVRLLVLIPVTCYSVSGWMETDGERGVASDFKFC